MRRIHFLALLFLSIWLCACVSFQAAGNIAQGRQALFKGNNQAALGYFHAAEQLDPAYVYDSELDQGVLSYVGRAQYLTGNYGQARSTLENALSRNPSDNIARLYLGLTLARQGETQKAVPDIDNGMKGIYDLLNYIADTFRFGYGQYWDPVRDIRSEIERSRAVIAGGKIDWPTLIADGESIALKTEREPDLARQNRRTQQSLHAD